MNGRLLISFGLLCFAAARGENLVQSNVTFMFDTLGVVRAGNPILAQNGAIGLTLKALFYSQATPIVLNGSLAHAVLRFLTLKDDNVIAEEELPVRQLIVQAVELYAKRDAVDCQSDEREKLWHQFYEVVKKIEAAIDLWWQVTADNELPLEQKQRALQHIAHIFYWMKNSLHLDEGWGHRVARGYGFYQLFELAGSIDKSAWDVYVLQGSYGLAVFIPRTYKEALTHKHGASIAGLGFNLRGQHVRAHGTLNDWSVLLRETHGGWWGKGTTIVDDVAKLFNKTSAFMWNVFLVGHGFPVVTPNDAAIREILKPRHENLASMTGVSTYEFLRLLAWFNTIHVNALVWQTCFGGGYHAQCVSELFKLVRVGNRVPLRYVPISIAPGDAPTQASFNPDFMQFFKLLAVPFEEGNVKNQITRLRMSNEMACAWWTKALRCVTADSPIVLLPYERIFKPIAQVGKIAESLVVV